MGILVFAFQFFMKHFENHSDSKIQKALNFTWISCAIKKVNPLEIKNLECLEI